MSEGYRSIELGQPGKPACPDSYNANSTVECGGAKALRVQTSIAGVYVQFGTGYGAPVWGPEEPLYPTVGTIRRRFDAVRVRNYIAGQPAQVLLSPQP